MVILIRLFLFLPWIMLKFLPIESKKRFIPVTIFSTFFTFVVVFIGIQYNFWKIKGSKKTLSWNILSIILGFFPIGNFIVFHLFYGKFKRYLLGNFIMNILYAQVILPIFKKLNFLVYDKYNKIHHMLVTMTIAVIVYRYQMFLDNNNFMNKKKLVK